MNEFTVRVYATFKDKLGRSRVQIELPDQADVALLAEKLATAYPAIAAGLPTAVIAINREYADPDTPIKPGDEIALFPPVSGGSGREDDLETVSFVGEQRFPVYFSLAAGEVDLNAIHAHLTRPDVGAIVTFSGSVRGETNREGLPPQTLALEYEAYEQMAIDRMGQIAEEIWEKYPLVKGIAIVQRIGKLTVGDSTTLVACASGHRDQGVFDAARYGIDRLKEIVPVWKKEIGSDQSVWVEGDYQPTSADNRT